MDPATPAPVTAPAAPAAAAPAPQTPAAVAAPVAAAAPVRPGFLATLTGSAGTITALQEQISSLQTDLATEQQAHAATRESLSSYPLLQELVHAKVDSLQEEVGMERFDIEFDRALANELRKAGLA